MSTNIKILYAAVGAAMFILGAALFAFSAPPSPDSSDEQASGIGGAFSLLDGDGNVVTEEIFNGKPYAIMFGFTHCPDICPAGLAKMAKWQAALGEDKDKIKFAFVTVDPARDTPARLSRYVNNFGGDILPLSGSEKNIAAMLKTYAVHAAKVDLGDGNYTIDHHSAIFLFNKTGQFAEFIYTDDSPAAAMEKLRDLTGI